MEVQVFLSFLFLTLLFSTRNVVGGGSNPYAGKVEIMVINNCYETIWPAVYTQKGDRVTPTGFAMESKDISYIKVPDTWSGIVWARTGCRGNPNSNFHCDVGDCGTGNIHCHYSPPKPPVTLVKFKLVPKGGGRLSYHTVDIKNGFNLVAQVQPFDTKCREIGWFRTVRQECPNWLSVYSNEGTKIACKSACLKTGDPKDCCTGAYASQQKCPTNVYTELVGDACPDCVDTPFEEPQYFKCDAGTSYIIKFCN